MKGKANPLYSAETRPFHNISSVFVWGIAIFLVSSLFWPNDNLQRLMLPLFGMAGFAFHLVVDGILSFFWIKNKEEKQKSPLDKK